LAQKTTKLSGLLAFILLCIPLHFLSGCGGDTDQQAEKEFNASYAKGNDCLNRGDFSQAVACYSGALAKANSLPRPPNFKALAKTGLAQAYLALNQYDDAAKACSQAVILLQRRWKANGPDYERRDGMAVARAALLLGQIYRKQEKYVEAEASFRYALRVDDQIVGPLTLKDDITQSYAELLRHLHRDADAQRLKRSDTESVMFVGEQTEAGVHLLDIGHLEEAATMLAETAKFAADNDIEGTETIKCLDQLTEAYDKLNRYKEASKTLEQELSLLKKLHVHSPMQYSRANTEAGAIALGQGHLDTANEYLLKALKLCREDSESKKNHRLRQEGALLRLLGELRSKQHNLKAANEYFNQAIKVYTEVGEGNIVAEIKKEMNKHG